TNLGNILNFFRKDNSEDLENADEQSDNYADLSVINSIKEDEIEKELDPEVVHFDEEEEEEFDESELELITSKVSDSIDEMENGENDESEVVDNYSDDEEFSVDIAAEEKVIEDDDMDALRKEFGEYDPTLDLASYVLPPIDLLNDYGGKGINIDKA